jgi:hypothetical protein
VLAAVMAFMTLSGEEMAALSLCGGTGKPRPAVRKAPSTSTSGRYYRTRQKDQACLWGRVALAA